MINRRQLFASLFAGPVISQAKIVPEDPYKIIGIHQFTITSKQHKTLEVKILCLKGSDFELDKQEIVKTILKYEGGAHEHLWGIQKPYINEQKVPQFLASTWILADADKGSYRKYNIEVLSR